MKGSLLARRTLSGWRWPSATADPKSELRRDEEEEVVRKCRRYSYDGGDWDSWFVAAAAAANGGALGGAPADADWQGRTDSESTTRSSATGYRSSMRACRAALMAALCCLVAASSPSSDVLGRAAAAARSGCSSPEAELEGLGRPWPAEPLRSGRRDRQVGSSGEGIRDLEEEERLSVCHKY